MRTGSHNPCTALPYAVFNVLYRTPVAMRRSHWPLSGILMILVACLAAAGGAASAAPFLYPGHDEVIAWVPAEQAETAAIARGLVHIELHRARQLAAQSLCEGSCPPDGRLIHRDGPHLIPPSGKGTGVWMYRLARVPQDSICNIDKATFLRAVSSHLPPWIVIRGANHSIAWRQGRAITAGIPAHFMVLR